MIEEIFISKCLDENEQDSKRSNNHYFSTNEFDFPTNEYDFPTNEYDFPTIQYVFSGKGTFNYANKKVNIQQGEMFLVSSGVPHSYSAVNVIPSNLTVYCVGFKLDLFQNSPFINSELFENAKLHFFNRNDKPYFYNISKEQHLGDLFDKLYREKRFQKLGYTEILLAGISELFVNVARLISLIPEENSNFINASQKSRKIVEFAINYLKDNFRDDVKLNQIGEKINVSDNHLSRVFKQLNGNTFSKYLLNLRLDEACLLLRTTTKTNADIMILSGFKDIKHFYSIFKKAKNMTPKQYREING